MNLYSNDLILGYDRSGRPVTLPFRNLVRHMYICGKSGSGKSKMIEGLLRQFFAAWPQTRSGFLFIDPHASSYDATISWLAASGFNHVPVVPFDLRSDWICSLNVLRPRPGYDPAPLMHAAVRAVLHGWKQGDATETPRLTKWLETLFATLYSSGCTLLEALDIIRSRQIRSAMARQVEDAMAKSVWMAAANLREESFQTELESTMNRLGRFLSTKVLRLAFAQSDISLDMHAALVKGHIILASLATEGSRIAEEDAAVVGSLLVNEVFCAARHRGKKPEGHNRQFTVIIDEFQEYVSPVIAQSLAQLRGMNVGFVTAHQSMQQLLDLGPVGGQVLNALISNTGTQIIFHAGHPADLDILTPWIYRNNVDGDQVKFQPYSTKVLDYKLEYLDSVSRSTTRGTSTASTWSTTESEALSAGTTRTRQQSVGESQSTQRSRSLGENSGLARSSGESIAESQAESSAEGTTEGHARQRTRQKSASQSEQRHLDGEYDDLAKVIGPEPTTTFDRAYTDEDEEHRALHRTIDKGASHSESTGNSVSKSLAATRSKSRAQAVQKSKTRNESHSIGSSLSVGTGEADSRSRQTSDGLGTSEVSTKGTAESVGGSVTDSESSSEGVTSSPMLMPLIGKEAQTPLFRSTEEQLFIHSQKISGLRDRQAIVRTGSTPPVEMTTATVSPADISEKGVRAWATLKLKRLAFAMPVEEATRRLAERRLAFEEKYLGAASADEPKSVVRRIKGRIMDDIIGIFVAVVIIALVVAVVVVGIAFIAVGAAIVGVIALLVMLVKAIAADIRKSQAVQALKQLQLANENAALARRAQEEVQRQEARRRELIEEQERLERERERQEQVRQRQERDDAARARLETESNEAAQAFARWNNGLLFKRPSSEEIASIVESASSMHSHRGKCLHVIALVARTGVALEWKVYTGAGSAPHIMGMHGNEEMFSEWAFAGRHTARLLPGRHVLAFQVTHAGQTEAQPDLAFEVFVPAHESPLSIEHFKQAIDATADAFVSKAQAVSQAKCKVSQSLALEGTDPDVADVEMAKFEREISRIEGEQ